MSDSTTPKADPLVIPDAPKEWNGMTLDDLRRARAKALIRREVGRASMQYNFDGMRTNVANNGWRALMFSPSTIGHLKTADYVLLGFKVFRWFMSMRRGSGRRR